MKKIKEIELVFENCDSVRLPIKNFETFVVEKLEKMIKRTASNNINVFWVAHVVCMRIWDISGVKTSENFNENAKDRLCSFNDISSIYLYGDDFEECIYVDFCGRDVENGALVAEEEDGREIDLTTPEKLYDYLAKGIDKAEMM